MNHGGIYAHLFRNTPSPKLKITHIMETDWTYQTPIPCPGPYIHLQKDNMVSIDICTTSSRTHLFRTAPSPKCYKSRISWKPIEHIEPQLHVQDHTSARGRHRRSSMTVLGHQREYSGYSGIFRNIPEIAIPVYSGIFRTGISPPPWICRCYIHWIGMQTNESLSATDSDQIRQLTGKMK